MFDFGRPLQYCQRTGPPRSVAGNPDIPPGTGSTTATRSRQLTNDQSPEQHARFGGRLFCFHGQNTDIRGKMKRCAICDHEQVALFLKVIGAPGEIRTPDPLVRSQRYRDCTIDSKGIIGAGKGIKGTQIHLIDALLMPTLRSALHAAGLHTHRRPGDFSRRDL